MYTGNFLDSSLIFRGLSFFLLLSCWSDERVMVTRAFLQVVESEIALTEVLAVQEIGQR